MKRHRSLRLVVLDVMGRCPLGGQNWLYLNWLQAFSRLGHEVYYVEEDTVWPYDPEQNAVTEGCGYVVRHISACLDHIGLVERWAFRFADRKRACRGMSSAQLDALYRSCDALLNTCGATDLRQEHMAAPLRRYVETDPVTAELGLAMGDEHTHITFANHDLIVTYGANYGAPDCGVPLNGLDSKYRKTRQPIDLDLWPMVFDPGAPTSRQLVTIGSGAATYSIAARPIAGASTTSRRSSSTCRHELRSHFRSR